MIVAKSSNGKVRRLSDGVVSQIMCRVIWVVFFVTSVRPKSWGMYVRAVTWQMIWQAHRYIQLPTESIWPKFAGSWSKRRRFWKKHRGKKSRTYLHSSYASGWSAGKMLNSEKIQIPFVFGWGLGPSFSTKNFSQLGPLCAENLEASDSSKSSNKIVFFCWLWMCTCITCIWYWELWKLKNFGTTI